MSLGIAYWIFAWVLMGIAFLTATIAILVGAKNLDRASEKRNEN
jgi:hypothetical protein